MLTNTNDTRKLSVEQTLLRTAPLYTLPVACKKVRLKDNTYSYYGVVVVQSVGAHDRAVPHQVPACGSCYLRRKIRKNTVVVQVPVR